MADNERAWVANIQHFCVHDGNGFRTTVFLQGCSLRCKWCQNPELQAVSPVQMYDDRTCTGCLACEQVCPQQNLAHDKAGFRPLSAAICVDCMAASGGEPHCVKVCNWQARQMSSRLLSAREVLAECRKESTFWRDEGGITLSGGEPLLQPVFCTELGKACKDSGISLYIETCGFVPWKNIEQMLDFADKFLYDLKLITPVLRQYWLGASDSRDLNNLRHLSHAGADIVLRVTLIPLVNDTQEEFGALLDFTATLPNVRHMQLLPFHQLGSDKYRLAGMNYSMQDTREENGAGITRCCQMAAARGLTVDVGGTAYT